MFSYYYYYDDYRRADDSKSVVSTTGKGSSSGGGARGIGGTSIKRLATADQPAKMPEWASAISGQQTASQPARRTPAEGFAAPTATPTNRNYPFDNTKRFARRSQRSGSLSGSSGGGLKRTASAMLTGGVGGGAGGGSGGGCGGGGGGAGGYDGMPAGWRKSGIEPREAILQVASEFLTAAHRRLGELGEKQKSAEMLDGKAFTVSFEKEY